MVRLTVRQSGTPEVGLVYIGTTHTAIQAAIDYANTKGGGTIFIEHGIYALGAQLKLYSNIKLCGEYFGTVLKPSGSNSVISCTGTAGAELENITIEALLIGNDDKTVAVGEHGIYASYCGKAQTTGLPNGGYDASTVGKDKVNKIGVIVRDCWVQGNATDGIVLNSSANCSISGSAVQNNGGKIGFDGVGVKVSNSNNSTIAGNIVQSNIEDGIDIANGDNNVISMNICQNNYWAGIDVNNSSGLSITGNTCQNNSQPGIVTQNSLNNAIVGNTLQNNTQNGIALTSNSHNNAVTANTLQNNGMSGIGVSSSNRNAITGNTCQNNTGGGIKLETSDKNTITGNKYNSISITGTGNLNSAAHNQQVT